MSEFGLEKENALLEPPGGASYDPNSHQPPAGDWKDDDGQALDDYFKAGAQDAINYQLVQAIKDALTPAPSNRIINRRYYIQSGTPQSAILALPADNNRTYVRLSELMNNGFYLHSESFTLMEGDIPTGSGIVASTPAFFFTGVAGGSSPNPSVSLELYNFTGPLWIAGRPNSGNSKPVLLEIMAITS